MAVRSFPRLITFLSLFLVGAAFLLAVVGGIALVTAASAQAQDAGEAIVHGAIGGITGHRRHHDELDHHRHHVVVVHRRHHDDLDHHDDVDHHRHHDVVDHHHHNDDHDDHDEE